MSTFTLLAFGFCAAIGLEGSQDIVQLGYISSGECIFHMKVGDSHGETVTINGHEIGIEMIEGGAVIHVDELQFVIVKTEGV